MDTEIWGPAAWLLIHSAALSYPESQPSPEIKENYKKFFQSLVYVLPCAYCREHYKQHLERMPVSAVLHSRMSLFQWTVDLHNEVNESLGRPRLSYLEALTHIQQRFRRVPKRSLSPPVISLIVTLILLVIGSAVHYTCYRRRS